MPLLVRSAFAIIIRRFIYLFIYLSKFIFMQFSGNIWVIGWHPTLVLAPPPLGNPGSATGINFETHLQYIIEKYAPGLAVQLYRTLTRNSGTVYNLSIKVLQYYDLWC